MAADLAGAKAGGGSSAKNAYLQCLRSTLNAAICLANFGCQEIERNNKPEVEMGELLAVISCCSFARVAPAVVSSCSAPASPRSLARGFDEPCCHLQERKRVRSGRGLHQQRAYIRQGEEGGRP